MKKFFQKSYSVTKSILGFLLCWLLDTFLVWLGLTFSYGISYSDVPTSPLYNSPQDEMTVVYKIIPIVAAISALIFRWVLKPIKSDLKDKWDFITHPDDIDNIVKNSFLKNS